MSNWYDDENRVRRLVAAGQHREAVGGLWDEIGRLQLEFLVAQGLRADHTLLDIGCGAGRLAVRAVRHLGAGQYFGIDISPSLLDAARRELAALGLLGKLAPGALVATGDFQVASTTPPIDVAVAQSVFTHLPLQRLAQCLAALRPHMAPGGRLFATFFVALAGARAARHEPGGIETFSDRDPFHFSIEAIVDTAESQAWTAAWIGEWRHPRGQRMCEFRPPT